jgi:hypothetical protein
MQISVECISVDNLWSQTLLYNKSYLINFGRWNYNYCTFYYYSVIKKDCLSWQYWFLLSNGITGVTSCVVDDFTLTLTVQVVSLYRWFLYIHNLQFCRCWFHIKYLLKDVSGWYCKQPNNKMLFIVLPT